MLSLLSDTRLRKKKNQSDKELDVSSVNKNPSGLKWQFTVATLDAKTAGAGG